MIKNVECYFYKKKYNYILISKCINYVYFIMYNGNSVHVIPLPDGHRAYNDHFL